MPARRNWSGLKAETRARYSRAGISPEAYASGVSLQAARGHARTPERIVNPEQLSAEQRERYSEYLSTRAALTADVNQMKRDLWGDDIKYRGRSAVRNTRGGSLRDMRFALNASEEDLEQLAGSGDARWAFLWYH